MGLVHAEVEIDAPTQKVFEILTDLAAYSEWNPFTPRVDSTLLPGDPVHLQVRLLGRRLSHRVEIVSANEPPSKLCWRMQLGPRFLLRAERCQTLTPVGEHRSHYVNEDRISGWLAPVVMAFFGPAMQRGFEEVALALKKRAEA